MSSADADADRELARSFATVARLLAGAHTVQELLDMVVLLATRTVAHCESAGLTQIVGRKVLSPASSNEIALTIDRIQGELGEGPCLDALREHEVFRTGRLATEHRWPRFSPRANRETGVNSILSVRLYIEENTLGSLNLYSSVPDAFDDAAVVVATVFATHAAVALSNVTQLTQLAARADTRDLIGRAKGILMAQQHVDDEQAFALLVQASQRLNVKLVEVAEDVNYTGEIRQNLRQPRRATDAG